MNVIRLTEDDWRTLRDVRLAALADAPYAYGSTLAVEQTYDQARWREWLGSGLWAVAVRNGENAGLVGVIVPKPDTPMLVAMWVNPDHRGHGVGDVLVIEILKWVREWSPRSGERRWSRVVLRVADGNNAARRLFLRHGFEPTGRRTPLESDPRVLTETLSYAI
jgi:RimJ/RimL family protein N-acetyltransferase